MKASDLKKIYRLIKPKMPLVALITALCIGSVALSLFIPIFTGNAIDYIVGEGNVDFDAVSSYVLKIVIAASVTALLQWATALLSNSVALYASRELRNAAFSKLLHVKIAYIDGHAHGELLSRIVNDVERVSEGLLMGLTLFIPGVLAIIGTLAFMFSINVYIAFAVVVITPLSLFAARFIAKKSFALFTEQSEALGALSSVASESVENFDTVKAFSYEASSKVQFNAVNERLRRASVRATFISSTTNPTTRFINGLVYLAVAMFGAFYAIGGIVSIGQLSAILAYAYQYTKPFNEISGVIAELQSALASFERIEEVILAEPESDSPLSLAAGDGNVEFSNVSFSYVAGRELIKNLNISVKSGARVAIVGPTGAGKTTLINLLMRFYDADSGHIFVDNQNIAFVSRQSLRAQMGMVLQDTFIKRSTVFENIAYAKPNATMDDVVRAARMAHADEFISRLPNGYQTVIGDETGALSEGERQLISIARVMLKLPPILILDEATSKIDVLTERNIKLAFDSLMRNRTTFVVAHRLVTIVNSDIILVMNNGAVVEHGSHEELINRRGFYYTLYNSK